MSGARDRYQATPKEQAVREVQSARAKIHTQNATARAVIRSAWAIRKTAAPDSFARAVLDMAEAEGLTKQLTEWW